MTITLKFNTRTCAFWYLKVFWATKALNLVPCSDNQRGWFEGVIASPVCYDRLCPVEQIRILSEVVACHVFVGLSRAGEIYVTGQWGHH